MKTAKDARYLINRKRLKGPAIKKVSRGGIVDARSILNSKLGQKSRLTTASSSGSFPFQRSFSSKKRPASSKMTALEKQVKVARDGNIVITAKSKNSTVEARSLPRWTPSDIDTTNVEHLGIDDVLDMDTLPSTALTHGVLPSNRSLAENIVDMQNTMIADQISTLQQPSVCVYVSNLHVSVSKQDIFELFGDIGLVKCAEMPRPGVAIVEYFDPNDAIKACELYHQRLLDGLPMMCQVKSQAPKRSLVSQRLGGKVESQPRIPPSLASSRSIHNPRNVRFTVKLT